MTQDPGISAPPTVREGGSIVIDVKSGVDELWVGIPGRGVVKVRVHHGRAEYQLPPGVTGGTFVFISDMRLPNPSGTSVEVVGNQ